MATDDPKRLVPIAESLDQVELATWRSLLTSAGIAHVVQAEHHANLAVGFLGTPVVVPRILVAQEDEASARQLLDARPELEGPAGAPLTEGLCTVHQAPGTAPCDRCGNFLCSHCKTIGQPPLCESCASAEGVELEARLDKGRRYKRWVFGVALVFALWAFGLRFLLFA